MKRILFLSLVGFSSGISAQSPELWTREYINEMMASGQFDKAAHDAVMDAVHIPAMLGGERVGECDCYEEPDATYTGIPNNQFAPNALDGYFGPVNLPFTFNHWGLNVNSLHINTKGTVSFGGPNTTFVPVGFPSGTHNIVAGYWADIDIRPVGNIYYKLTPNALFVNFVDVGYYNFHNDKKNTFQIIITDGTYEPIGLGNNVALCYKTMQWAVGDVNGAGGQGIPVTTGAAGTVGSNRPSNGFVQVGRFALLNNTYNGPFGANDGVFWLNNKSFTFNTAVSNANIPPIATEDPGCDTIKICINDIYNVNFNMIAPENNQIVNITVDASNAPGWVQTSNTSGTSANLVGTFTGSFANLGVHTLTITGTDNGNPPLSTTVQYIFEVIPVELPPISVTGNLIFCGGSSTTITASPGFEFYQWSEGCGTPSCEHDNGGTYTVTGNIQGCTATASFNLTELPYSLLDLTISEDEVCSLDSSLVCVTFPDNFVSYSIQVYVPFPPNGLSFSGTIYGADDEECAYVGPGTYEYIAADAQGCEERRIFNIEGIDAVIPEDTFTGAYCSGPEPINFEDGYINGQSGPLWFYMFQGYPGLGWNSASLSLVINGDTLTNIFTCNGPFCTLNNTISYGQYLQVIYNPSPAELDGLGNFIGSPNNLNIINCGGANIVFNTNTAGVDLTPGIIWEGWSACTAQPALGSWALISGPGGTFTNANQFNTTFTPTTYGQYEVCFTDIICNQLRCYDLEFNESPTISLDQEGPVEICAGEVVTVTATPTSVLNDATLTWSPAGLSGNPVNLTQAGVFVATATNNCGSASDDIEIIIPAIPDVALPAALSGCTGESFTLDPVAEDNPDFGYSWTGPGVNNSTAAQVTVNQSGTYSVTVQDGCNATTVTTVITLQSNPVPQLPAVVTGCVAGVTLDPIPVNNPDFTYAWTGSGVAGSTSPEVNVTQAGTYTVSVTSACGTGTATTNVIIVPNPTAVLEAVINDCTGSVALDPVANDDPSFVYSWTGPGVAGSTASNVTVTQSGTYQVTVSNACGSATASSSVTIGSSTLPVLPPAVNDCNGGPITLTVQDGIGAYAWSPGGETTNSITVTASGTYTVTVTDACGTNSATSVVSIGQQPFVNVALDTLKICPGISEFSCDFVTYSGNITSYSWTKLGTVFTTDDCPGFRSEDVPADALETGVVITVTVSGPCGTNSDAFVLLPIICNVDEFNVFTPNGDGINDFFTLGGADAFNDVKFKVFNRWGTLVFSHEDFGSIPGWDGGDQPAGTYFYLGTLPDDSEFKGSFTLLR